MREGRTNTVEYNNTETTESEDTETSLKINGFIERFKYWSDYSEKIKSGNNNDADLVYNITRILGVFDQLLGDLAEYAENHAADDRLTMLQSQIRQKKQEVATPDFCQKYWNESISYSSELAEEIKQESQKVAEEPLRIFYFINSKIERLLRALEHSELMISAGEDVTVQFLDEPAKQDLKNKFDARIREILDIKAQLEKISRDFFGDIYAKIKEGALSPEKIKEIFLGYTKEELINMFNTDDLDDFVDGLLGFNAHPRNINGSIKPLDNVHYHPTAARLAIGITEQLKLTDQDVFYDLGSGVGRFSILMKLLSEAKIKGVEYEKPYNDAAIDKIKELNLKGIDFVNADAQTLDYHDGTVFYMFHPFGGETFKNVMSKLEEVAKTKKIKLCTLGHSTMLIEEDGLTWLKRTDQNNIGDSGFASFAIFESQ